MCNTKYGVQSAISKYGVAKNNLKEMVKQRGIPKVLIKAQMNAVAKYKIARNGILWFKTQGHFSLF